VGGGDTFLDSKNIQPSWRIIAFKRTELSAMYINTGRFIMFSVITNIYNKKTKGPTLMEFFTATGNLKKFFFDN
jgi:hypothetical protein